MKKLFVIVCLLLSQNIFAKSEECEALKKPSDIMDTYVFAEQIGSVKEANYNGKMYRDVFSVVNKYLYDKCDDVKSKSFFDDAASICAISCEQNAGRVETNKKKAEAMALDCKSICKIELMAKAKIVEGMSLKGSDCTNPAKDEISNLGRDAKSLEKSATEAPKAKVLSK